MNFSQSNMSEMPANLKDSGSINITKCFAHT